MKFNLGKMSFDYDRFRLHSDASNKLRGGGGHSLFFEGVCAESLKPLPIFKDFCPSKKKKKNITRK